MLIPVDVNAALAKSYVRLDAVIENSNFYVVTCCLNDVLDNVVLIS
jgi:hypothetical protein